MRHCYIICVLCCVCIFPAFAAQKHALILPSDAAERKAEYIYMEAIDAICQEDIPRAYHLLERAYELDTTNTAAAYYLGCLLISQQASAKTQSSTQLNRALALIKKHFDASPNDMIETRTYYNVNLMTGNTSEALKAINILLAKDPNNVEMMAAMAEAYARGNEFAKSNEVYDSIVALNGVSMETTSKKLYNYVALHDTTGAINEMQNLLQTAPDNVEYNISMAALMVQLGKNDQALTYLNHAQEVDPDNGYIYLSKAQYYDYLNDSVAYDGEIYRALINPNIEVEDKINVMVSYIRDLIAKQDTSARVSRLFETLADQHPHEANIRELYCDYLMINNKYAAAAEQIGYALDIDPSSAKNWRKLLVINMLDENYPAAIQAAEKALQYNPNDIDLYRYIAPAYYQIGEYDRALDTYDRAMKIIDPEDDELRSDIIGGKGDVYMEMGDTVQAYRLYEEALEVYPENASILNNYAYFLAVKGQELDKAEDLAARSINAEPNVNSLDTYAWVFFKKKDYAQARKYIEMALQLSQEQGDKPSEELFEHYGDILFFCDEPDQAVEQWQKALEIEPDNELLKRKVNDKTYYEQ